MNEKVSGQPQIIRVGEGGLRATRTSSVDTGSRGEQGKGGGGRW